MSGYPRPSNRYQNDCTPSVANRGPGIPVEERKNVLRRFYRLEASRNSPGSGLGLSLVAAVANLHGTRIEMTDNSPGLLIELQFPILEVAVTIVQILSFDVSRVSFLLILIGVFMFRRSGVTRTRDLGRVGIGLGLILIALQHLLSMITPYEDVPSLRMRAPPRQPVRGSVRPRRGPQFRA
jgi:hypothetical protein